MPGPTWSRSVRALLPNGDIKVKLEITDCAAGDNYVVTAAAMKPPDATEDATGKMVAWKMVSFVDRVVVCDEIRRLIRLAARQNARTCVALCGGLIVSPDASVTHSLIISERLLAALRISRKSALIFTSGVAVPALLVCPV